MATNQVTRNIALTSYLDRFVKSKIDSGRHQSASEVVRDGLRLLEQREEELALQHEKVRQEIEVGWQQTERGETVDGRSVFNEIRKLSKVCRAAARSKK